MPSTPSENPLSQAISPTFPLNMADMAEFEPYLANSNLSAEEKKELLEDLWGLICEIVLLGFGMTSTHQVISDFAGQARHPDQETNRIESTGRSRMAGQFTRISAHFEDDDMDIEGGFDA